MSWRWALVQAAYQKKAKEHTGSQQDPFPPTHKDPVGDLCLGEVTTPLSKDLFQEPRRSLSKHPFKELTKALYKDRPKTWQDLYARTHQKKCTTPQQERSNTKSMQKGLRKLQKLSSRYKNVERVAGAKVKSGPRHNESDPTRTKCLKCCASKCCARHEHET